MHSASLARRVFVSALVFAVTTLVDPRSAHADAVAASKTRPPAVYSPGVAYDARRDRVVVFGGSREAQGAFGETWEWDGLSWSRVASNPDAKSPSPRNDPILVYDERRGVTVMYGGDARGEALTETWTWDGARWSRLNVETPAGRFAERGAYDSRRGEVVVMGGYSVAGTVREVWAWDGVSWSMRRDASPPRYLHGLTFNAKTNRLVTFGGNVDKSNSNAQAATGETWATVAGAWRPAASIGPSPRNYVNLVSDESRVTVVLYGGAVPGGFAQDTWEWDGRTWRPVDVIGPGPRANAALVYDSKRRRVMLYGGFDAAGPKNDLWAWDGKSWLRVE